MRAALLHVVIAGTAAAEFDDTRSDCFSQWCTSPDENNGTECWAGTWFEPCSCSQGTATMTGTTAAHFGSLWYKYTCCTSQPTDGEACGIFEECPENEYRDPTTGRCECPTQRERKKMFGSLSNNPFKERDGRCKGENEHKVHQIIGPILGGVLGLAVVIFCCRQTGWYVYFCCCCSDDAASPPSAATAETQMATSTATPAAVVMGTPVAGEATPIAAVAAAAPVGTVSTTAGVVKFSVSLDLDKRKALKVLQGALPESLAARGVSEHEWRAVCDRLLEFQEENWFQKNCGESAALCECCYWCVPLGPLQMILCMLSPCSWVLCILPEDRAAKKTNAAVTDVLSKHSVHCAVETGAGNKIKFRTT